MTTVKGKGCIRATVLADSINPKTGTRVTTLEVEMPRFIWSELLTHRVFSRNGASSRAIPIQRKISHVWNNPAMPIHWGRNCAGMAAREEIGEWHKFFAKKAWVAASRIACVSSYVLYKIGVHKQIANRILEPFEIYKAVITSTEWENFFWLRDDNDAQPEIQETAQVIKQALSDSTPVPLTEGQWHIPYVEQEMVLDPFKNEMVQKFFIRNEDLSRNYISLEDARRIGASCCAQVSYRRLDTSLEKALKIFDKLVGYHKFHASPFEHIVTPAVPNSSGTTHMDTNGNLWSGNTRHFTQWRHLIELENKNAPTTDHP